MNCKVSSDIALLYRELENQASLHPVRAIRLTGSSPAPLGLLVIGLDSPRAEVASALSLAEPELTIAIKLGNGASGQAKTARPEDSCQVTVEERTLLWQQPHNQFGNRSPGTPPASESRKLAYLSEDCSCATSTRRRPLSRIWRTR